MIAQTMQSNELGVFVFTGMPGVGKTALALWCADQARKAFDFDIVLEIGIGAASRARSVEDVLTVFLPALEVSPLPATRDGMLAAYRSALFGRSVLVLLDDVENAGQIDELLPPSASGVVIATSRRRSAGFEHSGFTTMPVDVFTPASAKELLTHGMDGTTALDEAEQLDALAELCGRLPLALGIARAHLRTRHRGRTAQYVHRLQTAKDRLREFQIEDAFSVANLYEVAYQELGEAVKSLYRQLSLHPGDQFDERIAVALQGPNHERVVDDDLQALVSACLLTDLGSGRYEWHVLVRAHAAGLASATDSPADQRRSRGRTIISYLQFTVARELVFSPHRARFGEQFDGRVEPGYVGEGAYARAVGDLELERANLRRIVRLAEDEGFDDLCWQLCEALETFLFQRDLHADGLEVHTIGLRAAQKIHDRTGEPRPLFRMRVALGTTYFAVEDDDAAEAQFNAAEEVAAGLDDEDTIVGLAKVHVWQAFIHQRRSDFAAAVSAVARSRQMVTDPRFPERLRDREVALLDMNGGPMLARVGRQGEGIAAGRRALAYFAAASESRDSEKHNHIKSVANLGASLALSGEQQHQDEAIALLTKAIALEAEQSMVVWQADSAVVLADLLGRAGRQDEAHSLLRRAVELFDQLGSWRAEELRTRLGLEN
ncbi:MAG TPA: NB-ARC domain-containing protein [Pseudonocardiaceae bacterium]|jgi:tetratricopeptide (TPR) repeat protein|nr:NB-ARC domain-containing protein [Pseudonocardiaceae bacterium]